VLRVSVSREVLYHDVDEDVGVRVVSSFEGIPFSGNSDEVEAGTDMLGVHIKLRVFCKLDCTLVVSKDLLGLGSL